MNTRFARLRSESGAITAGTMIGLLLLAAAVYIGLGATNADTAHFGGVPVPGTTAISLEKGDTDIYYAQKTTPQSGFSRPEDLAFMVSDSAGQPLEADFRGDAPKETDEGSAELVAAINIPAEGIYTVEASGSPEPGALKPELTFGQAPTQAVVARAREISEQLIGPVGVVLLIVLAALYLIPRIRQKNTKTYHYSEF